MTDQIKKPSNWRYVVPKLITHNPNISDRARLLWVILKGFQGPTGGVFPSRKYLMGITGWGASSLLKYMKELEDIGLVKRKQRCVDGKLSTNEYELLEFTRTENQRADNQPPFKSTPLEEELPLKEERTQTLPSGDGVSVKNVRKPPDPRHKPFIDLWTKLFLEDFNTPYLFQAGKDGSAVKKLLSTLPDVPIDTIMNYARFGRLSLGNFSAQKCRTISGFVSILNEIRVDYRNGVQKPDNISPTTQLISLERQLREMKDKRDTHRGQHFHSDPNISRWDEPESREKHRIFNKEIKTINEKIERLV